MAHIRTVPGDAATGELAEHYQAATDADAGRLMNVVRVQGLSPPALAASRALHDVLMRGESPLGLAEREMIAVVVSGANHCFYGMHAHAAELRKLIDDEALVSALVEDYRLARVDQRIRSILDFAVLVTKDVHLVSRVSVQELLWDGLSDEEVLMVVQIASFINYENRLVDALGVEPEEFMPKRQ